MREKGRRLQDGGVRRARAPRLTPRETDVLQLASHGLTLAEVSEHLSVSVATIKTHHKNIYSKLSVSDKAEAVAFALRNGLIR
jgi:DNA-binding NarL/FixJ family response regulator